MTAKLTGLLAALLLFSLPVGANDAIKNIGKKLAEGELKGITSSIISVDGEIIIEAYAPGVGASHRHDIRSATKSITAILVGELIEDGSLKSVKTKVADILPDEFSGIPGGDPKRDITVEDLLTMRSGLACNDWDKASLGHEDKMYRTRDWAEFLLDQPMAYEVGDHFSYCTGGVVLLGRVIKKLSGQDVPDFAEERLFVPLGIEKARWRDTPRRYTDTGGHLRLTVSDLHKIGQLVLNGGAIPVCEKDAQTPHTFCANPAQIPHTSRTGFAQIIAENWLRDMMEEHTTVYGKRERYGYLWWLDKGAVKGKPMSLMYAHGNGGTYIFVVPELKLVAAFTGKNFNKPEQMIPLQLLSHQIVPSLVK